MTTQTSMTREQLIDLLARREGCGIARDWVAQTPGSPQDLWDACEHAAWLLRFAAEVDRTVLVLAACGVARTMLWRLPNSEDLPRIAIETAEAWCCGEANIKEVRDAAHAATEACDLEWSRSLSFSSYASVNAAYTACAPSSKVGAYAAATAEVIVPYISVDHANIVRQHISWSDVEASLSL